MTKITPPPFILELWGKLNKGRIAFRRFRKTIVLETDPSPSYTRTTLQATVRNLFKEAIEQWNKLTPEEKEQYDQIANKYGLTGYQYFISLYMKEHLAPPTELQPAIEITITEKSGTDLTDYQVLLAVNNDPDFFNAVGTDTTKLEIRAEDKTTLLDFYIEEWDTENNNAKIWIKIPNIPANGTVKAYIYSNPDRTTPLSDPEKVFDFFDDFEGDSLDTTKWDKVGDGTIQIANSEIIIDISSYSTSIYSKQLFGVNTILEVKWRASSIDLDYPGFGYGNRRSTDIVDDSATAHGICIGKLHAANNYVQGRQTNDGQNIAETGDLGVDHSTYHIYQIRRYPDHSEFYVDGVFKAELTNYYPTEDLYVGIGGHTKGETGQSIADWIRVRKLADPEPSISYTILT